MECVHYWLIEPAENAIAGKSIGECKRCHEVRAFRNSIMNATKGANGGERKRQPAVARSTYGR